MTSGWLASLVLLVVLGGIATVAVGGLWVTFLLLSRRERWRDY